MLESLNDTVVLSSQMFTLSPPTSLSHPFNTHIQIIMRRHMEVEGEAWEEDCGTPESPGFTLF